VFVASGAQVGRSRRLCLEFRHLAGRMPGCFFSLDLCQTSSRLALLFLLRSKLGEWRKSDIRTSEPTRPTKARALS
jgi:hypothetical protein